METPEVIETKATSSRPLFASAETEQGRKMILDDLSNAPIGSQAWNAFRAITLSIEQCEKNPDNRELHQLQGHIWKMVDGLMLSYTEE